jgi:hypothetical protein
MLGAEFAKDYKAYVADWNRTADELCTQLAHTLRVNLLKYPPVPNLRRSYVQYHMSWSKDKRALIIMKTSLTDL